MEHNTNEPPTKARVNDTFTGGNIHFTYLNKVRSHAAKCVVILGGQRINHCIDHQSYAKMLGKDINDISTILRRRSRGK